MLSRFTHQRLFGAADPFQSPYRGSDKGGGAEAPDLTPLANASKEASAKAYQAASDDLAFRKQVYNDSLPYQKELADKASTIADQQIGLSDIAQQRSEQQWQDYGDTYRPTEKISALDSYGDRYLNDEDRAGLQNLLNGGTVSGGQYTKPDQYNTADYDALQQRIKAGGGSALSPDEINQMVDLQTRAATPGETSSWMIPGVRLGNEDSTVDVGANIFTDKAKLAQSLRDGQGARQGEGLAGIMAGAAQTAKYNGLSDDQVIAQAIKDGAIMPGSSSGPSLSDADKSALKSLLAKQAAGPGAYQLTDADKAIINKYNLDKSSYEDNLKKYNTEQDNLRLAGLDSLTRKAENAAAGQAETRADADNASAFAQAQRSLSRLGGDPSKMAANAVGLANVQALNRTNAGNTAREQAADKLAAMRAGTVATGRNQVNTAGQNVGLSTGAGSSAVQNQQTGFMSALPYAQYQSGATPEMLSAAQLQQQGALGLGSLMNQQYGVGVQQNAAAGQGTGALVGAGATVAAAFI